MFYVSLVLVIVAAVTLVIGLLSSGLPLVIVSIASSFAAGVFLILTVVRDRPQLEAAAGEESGGDEDEEEAERERAEAEDVEFPIADYDDLKVSEIVPLLPELDDDELEEVREREEAGKGRATVLGRIDELLAAGQEEWAEGAEFPIADYDDLKVSEIVPLLPELDDDELEEVREREEAGKGRTTVLGRIDELLGGGDAAESDAFPIADYDDLNVGDVASVLDELTEVELEVVRSYEKKNKARKGVLSKIDAELNRR